MTERELRLECLKAAVLSATPYPVSKAQEFYQFVATPVTVTEADDVFVAKKRGRPKRDLSKLID